MKEPMKRAISALSKLSMHDMGRAWGIAAARRIRQCEKTKSMDKYAQRSAKHHAA